MQCNLSAIELELTIENTILQLIARRVISSYHFRRFQTMMNLCWVGCWNRVPRTTEISVFVSLVHSLPCSQSLHCHRAQESEVFQKANARRSLPSRRRVRTFAPMYQCTYILTLNEFLSHESPFLAFRKAETPHTHLHTVQCQEFTRGSVTGSGGSRNRKYIVYIVYSNNMYTVRIWCRVYMSSEEVQWLGLVAHATFPLALERFGDSQVRCKVLWSKTCLELFDRYLYLHLYLYLCLEVLEVLWLLSQYFMHYSSSLDRWRSMMQWSFRRNFEKILQLQVYPFTLP